MMNITIHLMDKLVCSNLFKEMIEIYAKRIKSIKRSTRK